MSIWHDNVDVHECPRSLLSADQVYWSFSMSHLASAAGNDTASRKAAPLETLVPKHSFPLAIAKAPVSSKNVQNVIKKN